MRKSVLSPLFSLGVMLTFMLAALAGSVAASDQGTPEAEDSPMHPAHIHAGTCPDVGDVAYPLNFVVELDDDMATPGAMSSPEAESDDDDADGTAYAESDDDAADEDIYGSTTTVDASVDEILGSEHAVNLHLSKDQADVYIACGDLTGEPTNGELVIDLNEQNDSGVSGTATLTDNGDGTSTLVIEVRHVSMNAEGTPESTPKP